jgi:hypothetical protein
MVSCEARGLEHSLGLYMTLEFGGSRGDQDVCVGGETLCVKKVLGMERWSRRWIREPSKLLEREIVFIT